MGLFSNQLANVVEWEEYREDLLFWKWNNSEIKKGSKLIIRPGQDAIFMYNGKIEGIFEDDGEYDIESQIIPFLSTLKAFKFGFHTNLRAEVLFINTKELTVKWGTRQAINIPSSQLPGGLPIRALGTFNCKIGDYVAFIDKVAGIKRQYSIDDVKERVLSVLDQLLMKWIMKEGKDMFNLQANAFDISRGICSDLDMEVSKIGLEVTGFQIASFSYPEEVQKMINKVASQSMVGNVGHYQQVSMIDAMASGRNSGGNMGMDMANMQMGMMMGQQMANNMFQNQQAMNQQAMNQPYNNSNGYNNAYNTCNNGYNNAGNRTYQNEPMQSQPAGAPKFCPNCGTKTEGARFCPNCGQKLC